MKQLEISGRILAYNTLLNFIGQGVSLLIGVATIPFIIRGLGTDRFGLLSIGWVILGYLTIFDLGLGRATTKYVAEVLGKGEEDKVAGIVWTAVTIQGLFGLLGALFLIIITPLLVEHILNIPTELLKEAKATFNLVALAIPLVLVSSSFSGVLEATQRFDLMNAVKIPSSASMFLIPLVGLSLGLHLPGIMGVILISKVATSLALLAFGLRVLPKLGKLSASFIIFSKLFKYGGWITLTNIIGPILVYLDRFMIASFLSIAAVTYYTAPYEAVTRLWIIPFSLTMTLFPAFSAMEKVKDQERLRLYFARSVKFTLLTLGPIVLILQLFAKKALQIWLGGNFAMQSVIVLQLLAVGVLVNSLAHVPYVFLLGMGRPDIPAKFHLLELPIHVGVALILICRWGIVGAAAAWSLRVLLDAILLFIAAFRVCRFSPRLFSTNGLIRTSFLLLLLFGISYGLKSGAMYLPFLIQSLLLGTFFVLFYWVAWRNVLDASDRWTLAEAIKLWKKSESVPRV
ncbi:MAG: flippase [Candidatus Hodarchaeota archaeon]